ncbi:MAG: hypothetical protein KDA89_04990 [Planctomycetaceae bacterium]|nr:hypothetical protein [Planctomycetaceae bacterium]
MDLDDGNRYLLLGCLGSGMTALAEILLDQGAVVSGMDAAVSPAVLADHPSRHLFDSLHPWSAEIDFHRFDVCVVSPAVDRNAVVVKTILAAGVPMVALPEAVARAFHRRRQICVAGTHGKSTTAAMLAWIFERIGRPTGFFIGGRTRIADRSGRWMPEGPVVLESCEYRQSFLAFSPATVILTGIERDHFDCYPQAADEDRAFEAFVRRIPRDGTLICPTDCSRSSDIAGRTNSGKITFRVMTSDSTHQKAAADWTATNIRHYGCGSTFQCLRRDGTEVEVSLNVPGVHNIANAVAAMAAAVGEGVRPQQVAAALQDFSGVRRRFEHRGEIQGIVQIDDYAHHPTAVRQTLQAARRAFPNRKIIAVFEPHQVVRTRRFFLEFADALKSADEILLLPVLAARESSGFPECCRVSGDLVRHLNASGQKAYLLTDRNQVVSRIEDSGRPGDVLITMGAGKTDLIHDELHRRFQRHSVA